MKEQSQVMRKQRTAKKRKRGSGRIERNAPDDAAVVEQHGASEAELHAVVGDAYGASADPHAVVVDPCAEASSPACDVAEPQVKPPQQPEEKRGLVCSRCGCRHFRVIYTRAFPGGVIRRRRECRHCGRRVTTKEAVLG